jgi:hypothetical protein
VEKIKVDVVMKAGILERAPAFLGAWSRDDFGRLIEE